MVPFTIMVFILANFVWPFNPGSIVQINFFSKGMNALVPGIAVSFGGWTIWWLIITNVYIVLWTLFVKFILRVQYPEIAALGDQLSTMGDANQKMNGDQKFGLAVLIGFLAGMFIPNVLPSDWAFVQIFERLGLTGMLCLVLCIMCAYQKRNGEAFITLQGVSKGIVWNIIWLLVATEPLANAFNAEQCGIMPSIMSVVTPILMQMSSAMFLVAALIILGLVTQVVHNFVLMVVFIPLLCPLYAQMGGNPYVIFFGLVIVLNAALATPAASYTSALMFGEGSMETKHAYIQGISHFVFSLLIFFLIGWPLANLLLPFSF